MDFAILQAFLYVLSVVPKQGIVIAIISSKSSSQSLKASYVSKSAKVESKPPDKPKTALVVRVCFNRFAKAWASIETISLQRISKFALQEGING